MKKLIHLLGKDVEIFNPWLDHSFPSEVDKYLIRTTGVYGNDLDLEYLRNLKRGDVLNPLKALEVFRGKDTQYLFFDDHGLPSLKWMNIEGKKSDDLQEFRAISGKDSILVKPLRGQGGWGIKVLKENDINDWFRVQNTLNDYSYLAQPYMKESLEFRSFFIQSDFYLTLKRLPTKGVSANFTQDGVAEQVKTPLEHLEIWKKVQAQTGIQYGAMDCLLVDGEWKILELNAVPGIEQLEKITGLDVAQEILNRLLTI